MRLSQALILTVCGVVVVGHADHDHGDGKEIPLHEREWVKDGAEELERRWGFEVSVFLWICFAWVCSSEGGGMRA